MTSRAGTSARSSRATLRRPSGLVRGSLGARCFLKSVSYTIFMCTNLCGRQAEAAFAVQGGF